MAEQSPPTLPGGTAWHTDAAGVWARRVWGTRLAEGPLVHPWGAPGSSAVEPAIDLDTVMPWTQFGGRRFSYLFCELLDVGPGRGLAWALPHAAYPTPGTGPHPTEARGNVKGSGLAKVGRARSRNARLVGASGQLLGGAQDCTASPPAAAPPSPRVPGQLELSFVGCQERAAASKLQRAERVGWAGVGLSPDSAIPPDLTLQRRGGAAVRERCCFI